MSQEVIERVCEVCEDPEKAVNSSEWHESICDDCEFDEQNESKEEPIIYLKYSEEEYLKTIGFKHDETEGVFAIKNHTNGYGQNWWTISSHYMKSISMDNSPVGGKNTNGFDEHQWYAYLMDILKENEIDSVITETPTTDWYCRYSELFVCNSDVKKATEIINNLQELKYMSVNFNYDDNYELQN